MEEKNHLASSFWGPLGYGDPNDKTLRKVERDIIIPKMLLEEAESKCIDPLKVFLKCAKEAGFFVVWKCKEENNERTNCISHWLNNEDLKAEITNKYLEARTHYRKTGEPLIKYVRHKKLVTSF